MQQIAVIGAGTMGHGIAHTFIQHGYRVNLFDISPAALVRAREIISRNMDRQVSRGVMTSAQKETALTNLITYSSLDEAVSTTELVVEAATEDLRVKLSLFRELDQYAGPGTILASNTSSLSITRIAAQTSRPEKVIGMHFMNPAPVMKLLELIEGYQTAPETTGEMTTLALALEKTPCVVKDYPGFIANRILMPMINEAVWALYEGVSGVDAIDTIMKLGMAHPMGPLQLADFIGLDVCLSILRVMQEGLGNPKYAPCPLLVNLVNAGCLGTKTGEGFYTYNGGPKDLSVSKRFLQ
ncbi:MAG TPA: 3-hydroxyacyl-CoA dehydrogenase NAD-binding domain-containing protein [Chitinophagaceae bacterium]|nr:3-hydroxyacyl-CoA dehydrogenase NAD-binding domain-containing protein [Chitinophagaceae bacterium]